MPLMMCEFVAYVCLWARVKWTDLWVFAKPAKVVEANSFNEFKMFKMLCIAYLHTYIRSIRISYFLPFFVNLHVPIFMYFICVLNCFTVYGFFILSLLSLSISLPLGFRIENSQHMKLYAIKLFNSNLWNCILPSKHLCWMHSYFCQF